MQNFRERFALLSVQSKVITAFLFGCIVVAFAWMIARIVFKETFSTIDAISKPNPKLVIINSLFQKIQRLDYSQKMQLLTIQNKSYAPAPGESKTIINLLDTLKIYCTGDTFQIGRIQRMQDIVYERDELFYNYLKFRYGMAKNNPLSKDIHNLSEYISKNIQKGDTNLVKTTKKSVITTTIVDAAPSEKRIDKKEPFFKRVFGKKKNKEELTEPIKKLITEDVEETVDTFAVTQRDSFMNDMARAISSIEKDRFSRRTTQMNHELKLTAAGTIFIDELEKLLRQVQSEEIRELQSNTDSLSTVFNDAFNWVEIILCAFLTLILVLIFLIFSDISHSNRIRLQLIEAKEKAEYLEQVKHRFLANMSHEIRTPLQAIIGYSEQIKDQALPPKHSLQAIYRSSEHLLQIVNEVLDYSRIVSGKFIFTKQDFDMEELVAEVASIMEGQAERKNVLFRLKSDIPANSLYSGDPFRLKQVLFNLLGNAIKFTDRGEVSFFISAKDLNAKKTEFTFEIKDTGIGMTEEELKRVFTSFEQASESTQSRYGGTGLGLSIAKKLTEMQGGSIDVLSEKNKGTIFYLHFCYLKSTAKLPEPVAPVLLPGVPAVKKVLVVDDDSFILQLCSTLLYKHNIPHVCYASSEKVLEDPWDEAISLVLLDIRMPVIDGIELFKRLKQKVGAEVRFIALTAQALPDEKDSVLVEGFDQVLLKPFREKELLQAMAGNTTAHAPSAEGQTGQLDLSSIKAMCMDDEMLFKKTVDLFRNEIRSDLARLTQALQVNSLAELAEACHRLAAKVGQAGFHKLAFTLRELETEARQDRKTAFDTVVRLEIKEKVAEVLEDLENFRV